MADTLNGVQPIGERYDRWQDYGKGVGGQFRPGLIEPPDTRPLTHEHWSAFVAWVEATAGIRKDVISLPGYAAAGYILFAAFIFLADGQGHSP